MCMGLCMENVVCDPGCLLSLVSHTNSPNTTVSITGSVDNSGSMDIVYH